MVCTPRYICNLATFIIMAPDVLSFSSSNPKWVSRAPLLGGLGHRTQNSLGKALK